MRLLEYEAKNILARYNVPVPSSLLILRNEFLDLDLPAVLKSQVPTGGRGKAGGVVVVKTKKEVRSTLERLFGLPIDGYLPQTILAEDLIHINKEYYISITIDYENAAIQLISNLNGGVEVENNKSDSYWKMTIGSCKKDNWDEVGESLAEYLNLPEKSFVLQDMVQAMYKCFVENDMTLLEINPLILTTDNRIVAGDCKIELDDAAAFRHPEWSFEQKITTKDFVTIDTRGNVATIANGAGLAMATVDAVVEYDMKPTNFLDIGGGASSEKILEAFKKIMEYQSVKAIVINIFAGITKCDEVAMAIISAKQQIKGLPPLFIRLDGTNLEQARYLLEAQSIILLPTLQDCLVAAKTEVNRE